MANEGGRGCRVHPPSNTTLLCKIYYRPSKSYSRYNLTKHAPTLSLVFREYFHYIK